MRLKARLSAALARFTPQASRLTVSIALCATLTSCGFHLRGQATLPFESMFIIGSPAVATPIARAVRAGSKTRIVSNPKEAEVTLDLLNEARERTILSLSSSGRIRELQIRYRISFRVYGRNSKEYIPPTEVVLKRDLIYSDSDVLGKEQEEALLYRDMQNDAVQQIIRRLEAAQPDTGTGANSSR